MNGRVVSPISTILCTQFDSGRRHGDQGQLRQNAVCATARVHWPYKMGETPQILVTGAGGSIGAALCTHLAALGHSVTAMVRLGTHVGSLQALGIAQRPADIRDSATMTSALSGIQVVMHLAAIHGRAGASDEEYIDVNVNGVNRLIEAAARAGVRRVVHVSSIGVHGDTGPVGVNENSSFAPRDIYTRSKTNGEVAAREAFARTGVEGVVIRPLGIYGPGDLRFVKLFCGLKSGRFPLIGPCDAIVQMCYMDTFVQAMYQAAVLPDANGQVYIVGDTERPTVQQFVGLVAKEVGGHPLALKLPLAPVALAARVLTAVFQPLGLESPLHPRRLEFYTTNRVADVSKAQRGLGLGSPLSLPDRVHQTAAWYHSQGLM
jgi:dihydroflavonol-4-reductase